MIANRHRSTGPIMPSNHGWMRVGMVPMRGVSQIQVVSAKGRLRSKTPLLPAFTNIYQNKCREKGVNAPRNSSTHFLFKPWLPQQETMDWMHHQVQTSCHPIARAGNQLRNR